MISISIHAPLCGGRQGGDVVKNYYEGFQSTPPCAGGDLVNVLTGKGVIISIHAPLCGGRQRFCAILTKCSYFNPRPTVRGATSRIICWTSFWIFQSTPPCAGGDCIRLHFCISTLHISIHAPLCGGRQRYGQYPFHHRYFNPRPPVRGATLSIVQIWRGLVHFNPRPPVRGATRC